MDSGDKNKLSKFYWNFGKACGCHQLPERSFFIRERQMALCSRCLGILIGEILLAPILSLLGFHLGIYSILFLIPLIIDGSFQYFRIVESTNIRRLMTGLLGGAGLGVFIIQIFIYLIEVLF